jgi:hypothetical protein
MAHDTVFFLAPDDETAAATHPTEPGRAFESLTCRFIEPDSAIAERDMYFSELSADLPAPELLHGWWLKWIYGLFNDGVEVFALPQRLIRESADADSTKLTELADRWAARLKAADGDDMTDDDLPAVLRGVARLAASAVSTSGGHYSWSFRPSGGTSSGSEITVCRGGRQAEPGTVAVADRAVSPVRFARGAGS